MAAALAGAAALLLAPAPAAASFGQVSTFSTANPESNPLGLATDAESLYVLQQGQVLKHSPGQPTARPGIFGAAEGQLSNPTGIAVDPAGDVWVADTGNDRLEKFSSGGTLLATIGSSGSGDGQFLAPSAITSDGAGNVYVAETGNDRVQKLSPAGAFLAKWGSEGSDAGQFRNPRGIAASSSGDVYVADSDNNRVQQFDANGSLVRIWEPGSRPEDIATAADGSVHVALATMRVQSFSAEGAFSGEFGCRGSYPGYLREPITLATGPLGDFYVGRGSAQVRGTLTAHAGVVRFGDPGAPIPCKVLILSGRDRQRLSRMSVSIGCPAQPCDLTIDGTVRIGDTSSRLRTVGRSLAADETARLKLRLRRPQRLDELEQLLERGKGHTFARVRVRATSDVDPANRTGATEFTFRLRKPRR